MAVGDLITAARFNNMQARIAAIMGNGSGTDGYGQTLQSSQVSVGEVVTAAHMANLYVDMRDARIHQTGSTPSSIAEIQSNDLIAEETSTGTNATEKGIADFENLLPTIESDKFLIASSQASIESSTSSSRTTDWNGVITHVFTVNFKNSDHRRHFFNAGGEIRFSAQLTNASSSKDSDWQTLLSNMGTIKFGYTSTTSTGSGSGSSIGNYDLTGSYQQLFIKTGSGAYSENDYNIQAYAPSASQIRFRIEFRDDDTGTPTGFEAVDENVTGDITSTIQQYRPTGSYVSVPSPSYNTNSNL